MYSAVAPRTLAYCAFSGSDSLKMAAVSVPILKVSHMQAWSVNEANRFLCCSDANSAQGSELHDITCSSGAQTRGYVDSYRDVCAVKQKQLVATVENMMGCLHGTVASEEIQ